MAVVSSGEISSFLTGGSISLVSDNLNTVIVGGRTSTGLTRNPFAFRLSHSTNQWRCVKLLPTPGFFRQAYNAISKHNKEGADQEEDGGDMFENEQEEEAAEQQIFQKEEKFWPPFQDNNSGGGGGIASIIFRDQLLVFGGKMMSKFVGEMSQIASETGSGGGGGAGSGQQSRNASNSNKRGVSSSSSSSTSPAYSPRRRVTISDSQNVKMQIKASSASSAQRRHNHNNNNHEDDEDVDWSHENATTATSGSKKRQQKGRKNSEPFSSSGGNNDSSSSSNLLHAGPFHNSVLVTSLSSWRTDPGPDKVIERLSRSLPLQQPSNNHHNHHHNNNNNNQNDNQQDLAGFVGASAAFAVGRLEDFGLSKIPGDSLSVLAACSDDDSGIAFLVCESNAPLVVPEEECNDEDDDEEEDEFQNDKRRNSSYSGSSDSSVSSDSDEYEGEKKKNKKKKTKKNKDNDSDNDEYLSPEEKREQRKERQKERRRKFSEAVDQNKNSQCGIVIHLVDLRKKTCLTAKTPLFLPNDLQNAEFLKSSNSSSSGSNTPCSIAFDSQSRTLCFYSRLDHEQFFLLPLPPALFARDGDVVPATNNFACGATNNNPSSSSSAAFSDPFGNNKNSSSSSEYPSFAPSMETPQTLFKEDINELLTTGGLSNWISLRLGNAPIDGSESIVSSSIFVTSAESQNAASAMSSYLTGGIPKTLLNEKEKQESRQLNQLHPPHRSGTTTRPDTASYKSGGDNNKKQQQRPTTTSGAGGNKSSEDKSEKKSSSSSSSSSTTTTTIVIVSKDSTLRYEFDALAVLAEIKNNENNNEDGGEKKKNKTSSEEEEEEGEQTEQQEEQEESKTTTTASEKNSKNKKEKQKKTILQEDRVLLPVRNSTSDIEGVVLAAAAPSSSSSSGKSGDKEEEDEEGNDYNYDDDDFDSPVNVGSLMNRLSDGRFLLFSPSHIISSSLADSPSKKQDLKILRVGERQWQDFEETVVLPPNQKGSGTSSALLSVGNQNNNNQQEPHFSSQLTHLPKRLSPERPSTSGGGASQTRPGTVGSVSSLGGGGGRRGNYEMPKVNVRSRNITQEENQQHSFQQHYNAPVPPSSSAISSSRRGGNTNNNNNKTGRPGTSSSALVPSSSVAGGGGGGKNNNNNNNATAAAAGGGGGSASTNLPAHRNSLSRMMLKIQPSEEKLITRSRVKTLLRGGHLSDSVLENLMQTFVKDGDRAGGGGNTSGAEAMLEAGYEEPVKVDVSVNGTHPHTSTVAIEGNTLPVDVHVLASYATDSDDTTIVAHWLDAQRLISVQLVQHVRVGEGRKKELAEMQHVIKDQHRDIQRQRQELHGEKLRLIELSQELDDRIADMDERERVVADTEKHLANDKTEHESRVEAFHLEQEAFESEKQRQRELDKEHERRRRTEVERQRSHDRSMEAELRKQEILNDQLQRQAEATRLQAQKLDKEMEKLNKERESFKRDIEQLRGSQAAWHQDQRRLEQQMSKVSAENKEKTQTIEQLHKSLKEAQKSEATTREELNTAVRIVEYFDGRRPSEGDQEWQNRKEGRRSAEEAASKGIFFAKTNMVAANSPFHFKTNTNRSVIGHVRDANHSTQLLPSASIATEQEKQGFSIKRDSYVEVEIGEGFCLGDVLFVNPSCCIKADSTSAFESAAAAGHSSSSANVTSSSNVVSFLGADGGGGNDNDDSSSNSSWFVINSKGNRVAECNFDATRRDLDALRFTLLPTNSAEQTNSALESLFRSLMFHTPTSTFTGTRTLEMGIFVVSPRISAPGGHCWIELDIVVVDPPLTAFKRLIPFTERGKAVSVLGHFKPTNPFSGWMGGDEQMKFAEQHAFFGTKGYNLAKLLTGNNNNNNSNKYSNNNSSMNRKSSGAEFFEEEEQFAENDRVATAAASASAAAAAAGGGGGRRNSSPPSSNSISGSVSSDTLSDSNNNNNNQNPKPFLGDPLPEDNNNKNNNNDNTVVSTKHQSEAEFFSDVIADDLSNSGSLLADPAATVESPSSLPLQPAFQNLKPPTDPNLRRLSPPSLEHYLSKQGPLAVRRCPTCSQMRRLPRFVILGKDKDPVSQFAVQASGTASLQQHNSNVVKTSTGNAATVLSRAIDLAAAMPEQWCEASFTFTLQKEQEEDCLQLGDFADIRKHISSGEITSELTKKKDKLVLTVVSSRGVPLQTLTNLLHCCQFRSTASPLASAARRITLVASAPNLIIPLKFTKVVDVPILNAPYHVEISNKRSNWTYYLNSIGIPEAKFDPPPLFFASTLEVSDELGLKFEGRAQVKINSPSLRRDRLRLAIDPNLTHHSTGENLQVEIRENPNCEYARAKKSLGIIGGSSSNNNNSNNNNNNINDPFAASANTAALRRLSQHNKNNNNKDNNDDEVVGGFSVGRSGGAVTFVDQHTRRGSEPFASSNDASSNSSSANPAPRRTSLAAGGGQHISLRRKSKTTATELDMLYDENGSVFINSEKIADYEISDLGCTLRFKFHRTTNVQYAQAVLRCVAFETVDPTPSSRRLTITTALGRGNTQHTEFSVRVRPGILVVERMGCIKWVEGQPPSLAASQVTLLDSKSTPQDFTIHIAISHGYEKGDLLELRPILRNARSTTIALPGRAGAPHVRLSGKLRDKDVTNGYRLLDSVFFFVLSDHSLCFVFVKEDERRQAATERAAQRKKSAEQQKREEEASVALKAHNEKMLQEDPWFVPAHTRPEKILKTLQNVVYIHATKSPKNLKKVLRIRSEDKFGIFSDCFLPVNVVPIDDPTEIVNVAERTLFIQNTYEAQRGLQLAPEAVVEDPDTDDFVGGFLSVEPVGRVSVRDELYILPIVEQIRRRLDGLVYVDDRNRLFVFNDEEEWDQYREALVRCTEAGLNADEAVTQCCVGVMRRIKMADGNNSVVDPNQYMDSAELDETIGGSSTTASATAAASSSGGGTTNSSGVPGVAMTSGGELHSAPNSFTATKIEFCFTPAEARLIPLEDVQSVLRAIAFRNDSTRISLHRRHYLVRLGAGVVNITSNNIEDEGVVMMAASRGGDDADETTSNTSSRRGSISERGGGFDDEPLKVADHTQVPISIKVVPGIFHFPPVARHHRYVRNTSAIFPARACMVLPLSRHIELRGSTLICRLVDEHYANKLPPAQPPNPQMVSAALSISKSLGTSAGEALRSTMSFSAGSSHRRQSTAFGSFSGGPSSLGGSFSANSASALFSEYTAQLQGEEQGIHFAPSKSSGLEVSGTKVLGFNGTKPVATFTTLTPSCIMFNFDPMMDSKHLQNLLRQVSYTCITNNGGSNDSSSSSSSSSSSAPLQNRSTLLAFDLYDALRYPKNTKYDEREDSDQDPESMLDEYPDPLPEDVQRSAEEKKQAREERRKKRKEEKRMKREKNKQLKLKQKELEKEIAKHGSGSYNSSTTVLPQNDEDIEELDTPKDLGLSPTSIPGSDNFSKKQNSSSSSSSKQENKQEEEGENDNEDSLSEQLDGESNSDDDHEDLLSGSDDSDSERKERPLRSKVFEYPTIFSTAIAIHIVDPDAAKTISSSRDSVASAAAAASSSLLAASHTSGGGGGGGLPSVMSFSTNATTTTNIGALVSAGVFVPTSIVVGASCGTEYPSDSFFLSMNFIPPTPPAEYISKSSPSPVFRFAQISFHTSDMRFSRPASSIILSPPASLVVALPQAHSGHLTIFEDPLLRCAKTDMRHNYHIAACFVEPEEISLVTERASHHTNNNNNNNEGGDSNNNNNNNNTMNSTSRSNKNSSSGAPRLTKAEQEALDEEAAFARAVRSACPLRSTSDAWENSRRAQSYVNLLEAAAASASAAAGGSISMNPSEANNIINNSEAEEVFLPQKGENIKPMLSGGSSGGRDGNTYQSGETRELRYRGYTVALYTPPTKAGGALRFNFLSCPASVVLEILRRVHYICGPRDKLRPGARVSVTLALRTQPGILETQSAALTVVVSAPIVDDLPSTPIVFSNADPAKPFQVIRVRNVSGFGGGSATVDLEVDGRQMHKISTKDYIFLDDANIQNVAHFTIKRQKGNVDAGEILMTSYQFQTPVVFGSFTLSPHSLHLAFGQSGSKTDRSFPPAELVQHFFRNCLFVGSSQEWSEKAPTNASSLSKFLCNLQVEDGSGNTSSGHVTMQAALPKTYTRGAGPRSARK